MGRDDKLYFKACKSLARKSDCQLINFGVVIVKNGKIIGTGYNHGVKPHKCLKARSYQIGSDIGLCYAIHAEWKAIASALRSSKSLRGTSLYIKGWYPDRTEYSRKRFACTVCARLICLHELKEVVTEIEGKIVRMSPEEVLSSAYEDLFEKKDKELRRLKRKK